MSAVGIRIMRSGALILLCVAFILPVAAFQQSAMQEAFFTPPAAASSPRGAVDGSYRTLRLPLEVRRVSGDPSNSALPFGGYDLAYNMTVRIDRRGDIVCGGGYLSPSLRVYRRTLTRDYVRAPGVRSELRIKPDSTFTEVEAGTGIEFHYDASGHLEKIEDPNGRCISITRDASGKVALVSDEAGRTITFTYSGNLISQASFSAGGMISYQYTTTARGQRLTKVTNLVNEVATWTYNDAGEIIAQSDPATDSFIYELTQSPRQVVEKASDGNVLNTTTVDTATNASQLMNSLNLVTYRRVDFRRLVSSETNSRGTVFSFDYDADRNLIRLISNYDTAVFRYGNMGEVLCKARSGGETFTYEYDSSKRLTRIVSSLDQTESFAYDSKGNITGHKLPSGGVRRYEYDASGNRTRIEDPDGIVNVLVYNACGFMTSRKNCDCPGVSPYLNIDYDSYGYVISQGNGVDTLAFTRDAIGRPLTRILPGGAIITTVWSATGPTSVSNSVTGETVTYSYSLGRLEKMTDAIGAVSKLFHFPSGMLASYRSPLSHTTSYSYDSASNLAGVTWPPNSLGTASRSYVSDSANRLVKYSRETNDVIEHDYDFAGRLLTRKANAATVATMTYDSHGRLSTAVDPLGTTTYTRNAAGQATTIVHPNGTIMNYDYSLAARLTRVSTTGYSSDIAYDSDGRIQTIGTEAGNIAAAYDAHGRLVTLTYPNGVTAFYKYGQSGATNRVEYWGVGSETIVFNITRDSSGRINRTFRSDIGETMTLDYNRRGEVAGAIFVRTTDTLVYRYDYDSAGNRVLYATNSGTTVYQYDAGNLLDTGGVNYAYNSAGAVTSIGSRYLTYTAEGMLQTDSSSQGTISYDYDAFGRRTRSMVGETVVWRLWDEAQNEIADASAGGSVMEFRYFLPGGMDGLLGFTRGSQTYFTMSDPAGNVAMVVDENGAIVARYAYDPFQIRTNDSFDSVCNSFRFARRREELSGEIFVRARSLEQATGRFMQRDPRFIGDQFDPFSWNGFTYANSSPVMKKDPTGEVCIPYWWDSDNPPWGPPVKTETSREGPHWTSISGCYVLVNFVNRKTRVVTTDVSAIDIPTFHDCSYSYSTTETEDDPLPQDRYTDYSITTISDCQQADPSNFTPGIP